MHGRQRYCYGVRRGLNLVHGHGAVYEECGGSQSASTVVALYCKECGRSSICVHGRIRSRCKECRAAKARTG